MPWAFVLLSGQRLNLADYRSNYWKRIAFLCRYGHVSLGDAMMMTVVDAEALSNEIGKMISEENTITRD